MAKRLGTVRDLKTEKRRAEALGLGPPTREAPLPPALRKIDGLERVEGAEALRERLRLLSKEKRIRIVAVSPSDVMLTLNELDALRRKSTLGGAEVGRRGAAADDSGGPYQMPSKSSKKKLIRFQPDVVAKVEEFAKAQGATKAWSFGKALNEILRIALAKKG